MQPVQVAGRHGSYATQFWKPSAWTATTSRFRNRAAMRAAYSRKALDRRLVLPLDSHNWVRSLEVLNAGYARLGRTPEHFQKVLRDMVEHHGPYAGCFTLSSAALARASPTQSPRCANNAETGGLEGRGDEPPSSAAETPAGSKEAADIVPAVDALRDQAYAGEIPSNRSLWVTLVWSYCALDQPIGALETFHLATRRFSFSFATMQHMATLLMPVLCQHAHLEEAIELYETYLKSDGGDKGLREAQALSHHRSRIEDADARRWLAEAAARRGDWKLAQRFASATNWSARGAPVAKGDPDPPSGLPTRPSIGSLFNDAAAPVTPALSRENAHPFASVEDTGTEGSHQVAARTATASSPLPMLQTLSRKAVRQLFRSLCRGDRDSTSPSPLCDALCCWEHLYGPVAGSEFAAEADTVGSRRDRSHNSPTRPPPLEDVHELLNLFAVHGLWKDALFTFCHLFLNRSATVYLSATPTGLCSLSHSGENGACPASASPHGESTVTAPVLRLDAITLNVLFSSLPAAAAPLLVRARKAVPNSRMTDGEGRDQLPQSPRTDTDSQGYELRLSASAIPVTVVRLLDDLLLRDDMMVTDLVMAAVGPALLQVGQSERAFDLLARTPMMVAASQRRAPVCVSTEHQTLEAELVTLAHAAFALCSSSAQRHEMVRLLPHLFPPEVVRRFATDEERSVLSSGAAIEGRVELGKCPQLALAPTTAANTAAVNHPSPPHGSTDEHSCCTSADSSPTPCRADPRRKATLSLLDMKCRAASAGAAVSGGRLSVAARPGRRSSAATLTSLADDAMRRDFVRLHERRRDAFTGSHADAERDPRPIPKGLHDHASGWDFFGRGGEMVFSNHKRTPHPFTMQPKVMRDLRNPYRGWSPRRNSSLAHKENVIKWNGNSAV
ncbi:hypothetical protein LSCM1_02899 [Leishmania martiniquensis]|uniref:Uncharacterized protein n=1 Tax=Leishmania martiniquensis TaxID=1580590 RepID=A0A836H7K1_9TRYP|nr:hypothetical protein LSCM1_02899 [Leishmania martiniquensis]